MTKKPKSDYAIQAVANALRLLHVFRDEDEIGVAELARRLELPKNNVFRLLATMEELSFIEQSCVSGRYRLGLACHALGQAFTRARPLIERARPVLDRLLQETGETVHLAVRDGFEVVHLDARAPVREIAIGVRTGRRAPIHCTALGKALLAWEPKESVERFLRRRLRAYTPSTRTDPDLLRQELAKIRASRHALDEEEFAVGLKCVAAPLFDHTRRAVASLGIAGPAVRLSDERLPRLTSLVREAAGGASRALGGDLNS